MIDWLKIPVTELPDRLSGEQRDKLRVSDRQLQVLQCMAKGMSSKEVAIVLGISPRTAEIHRRDIKHRTGLQTTAEIIITADRIIRDRPCACQQAKPPKPYEALVAAACEVE